MVWLMETPCWPANCVSSAFQIVRFRVREHLVQHLRDHGTQAEEQFLERVEEELDISTRRLAAEVEVSQFVVYLR